MKARSLAGPPFRKAARLTSRRYCTALSNGSAQRSAAQHRRLCGLHALGPVSPRRYLLDQFTVNGYVYVGYIHGHLTNTRTKGSAPAGPGPSPSGYVSESGTTI